jgi:integrase
VNDDLIARNPLDRVVLDKLLSSESRQPPTEVDPFDRDEIKAILGAVDGQVRNLFQFAFFSGLRTSELMGLEWGDIDWDSGQVHVARAVVERKVKPPKTRAGDRKVLLLPPALAALHSQKKFSLLSSSRVFLNPRTEKPWATDAQIRRTGWVHALKRAGVRYRNPYQTRHTFASMLLSKGENQLWLATQMGHETTEMLTRHYGRWIPDTRDIAGYRPLNDWGAGWDGPSIETV